ncbi:MAG: hypothetical protein EOO40_09345, partial [Deltaproteobacteria bacterium]
MTLDLSWRPNKRGVHNRRNVRLWVVIGLLVSANVAMFIYHGDPRTLLHPRSPAAQDAHEVQKRSPKSERARPSPAVQVASALPETAEDAGTLPSETPVATPPKTVGIMPL